MTRVQSLLLLPLVLGNLWGSHGVRILSLSFFTSKSHNIVYEPLLLKLAERGHDLTIINPYKSSVDMPNVRNIKVLSLEELQEEGTLPNFYEMRNTPFFDLINFVMNPFLGYADIIGDICRRGYQVPQVREIMNEKFDLIIFDNLFNDCAYGLVYHLKAPVILISSVVVMPWMASSMGTPSPPSFVPFSFLGLSDKMTFTERLLNFISLGYNELIKSYYFNPKMEAIYRELVDPNLPGIKEIEANTSLIIANSHISFTKPRPLMPDIVDAGGMHLKPAKPLPKDLEDFVIGAGDAGFIMFSMGSALKGKDLPDGLRKIFLNTFAKLKQRVLWKFETETMEGLPKNVKLSKWLPQQDLLGHKNIRLFITHGGHGSTQESIYNGVPIIGIPMFGDQPYNMKQAERLGFAIPLEFTKLSEELLGNAINEILNNPSYKQTAQKLSKLFHDQIDKPLDRALYWVEYVMRHQGAPHLRSAARDLSVFQYHSVDVIGFLLAVLAVLGYINFIVIRSIFRKCFGGKNTHLKKKKQ